MIYFLLMSLLFGQISYSCLFCSTPYGEISKLCFLFPSIASYHSRACCFRHLMIMYPILFSYTPTNSYISYSCLFLSPFACYISYYCYSTRQISYLSLFYPSDDVKISNPSLISISSWWVDILLVYYLPSLGAVRYLSCSRFFCPLTWWLHIFLVFVSPFHVLLKHLTC